MGGVLLNSSDVPILRKIINEFKRRRKNNPKENRKRWQGSGAPSVKRGVISELGDYDVHKVTLLSGSFDKDLTTDSLEHTYRETEAYVASEFDYHLEPGDIVLLAKIGNRHWIIEAKPDCEGYCINEDYNSGGYVYGWEFRTPNLPCCPEAGGVHILTTSDSGATYESATFQCNSDGTDRNWLFKDRKLRLTPRLDDGNIEYWTDNAPTSCTVKMQQYEQQLFPERADCGKVPKSICLNPLCGVGTCSYCSNKTSPMQYTLIIGDGGKNNPDRSSSYNCASCGGTFILQRFVLSSGDLCEWRAINSTGESIQLTITDDGGSPANYYFTVACGNSIGVWKADAPFDCSKEIELTYSDVYDPPYCVDFPTTAKLLPASVDTLEGNCYPISAATLWNYGTTTNLCPRVSYTLELEISGITDSTCTSCNEFNDSYRLLLYTASQTVWRTPLFSITCTAITGHTQMRWFIYHVNDPPNQPYLVLKLATENGSATGGTYELLYNGPRVDEFNCIGSNDFTKDTDLGNCSGWPSTITVHPVLSTI